MKDLKESTTFNGNTYKELQDRVMMNIPQESNERLPGELRNASSLHAGFYDLIFFFPVSSFILILDRCV